MPGASRTVIINAPMDKVFKTITDYEAYPQFLSECKEIKLSGRQGGEVNVHYKVDVVKTIKYTLRMREEPPNRLSWVFVEGEIMKDNHGNWLLEDAGGGKTKATYTVDIALPMFVPKAIVAPLVDAGLPKMVEAFKKRAETT